MIAVNSSWRAIPECTHIYAGDLRWWDAYLVEFQRVLKPAGSLYLFCGHRLASDIEVMMRSRFDVLNHIVWAKPNGRWNGTRKADLRTYFPATERILFASHHDGAYRGKTDGHSEKCSHLKQHTMKALIDYFRNAREDLGVTSKQMADATGKKNMVSHWFGRSQWQLPAEDDYIKLQALFDRIAKEKHAAQLLDEPHQQFVEECHVLNRTYDELKLEFKARRRYFAVSADVPHTDVWTHKPVPFYPGKHPCEKPADMLEQIISASSRPGDVVADFFMGSGSTVKAALRLGRKAIGVELNTERLEQTVDEIGAVGHFDVAAG